MISEQPEFQFILKKARDQVREGLLFAERFMGRVAEEAPGQLRLRLEKVIGRKGKRIRAVMLFLIAGSRGRNSADDLERQARVAASLEMLHLASLVHDDVIDESLMRRGMETANQEWGNKMAVLMGDYLLSKSMEMGVADGDPRIPRILSAASSRLVAGEIMEIDLSGRLDVTRREYFQVIEGKTASLFDACARCGAILAGYGDDLIEQCAQLGEHFGISFQIVDDLLDYGVGAGDLGKAKFADLANGLVTLPLLEFFARASSADAEEMRRELVSAGQGDQASIQKITERLSASGAFERSMDEAVSRIAHALRILEHFPAGPARDLLREICASVTQRNH